MGNELIRLIDPESARAIEETAKTGGKAVDAAVGAGRYVGGVLGDLPHDLVGVMGDWVKHKRLRRLAGLEAETEKILDDRGVKDRSEFSPSIAVPLIDAAINEDRDGLKELWARLLAAAVDPSLAKSFRIQFVDATKQMDPLDAAVLRSAPLRENITRSIRHKLAVELKVSDDEIDVSFSNLMRLQMFDLASPPDGFISPFGREFLRVVSN